MLFITAILASTAPALAANTPAEVNRVYTYQCQQTILEGEGASPGNITCVPGQRLGVITLPATYFRVVGKEQTTLPAGDLPFPGPICERNSFLERQCTGNAPKLSLGLSAKRTAEFPVEILLPTGPGETKLAGYAQPPRPNGTCRHPLVKARTYKASPKKLGAKLPTSFDNKGGNYDSVVFAYELPARLTATRQANSTPCDSVTGSCLNATFAAPTTSATFGYKAEGESVCVLPATYLRKEDAQPSGGGEAGEGPTDSAK